MPSFDLQQVLADEERLRRWHQGRIDYLKKYRLLRNLNPAASIMDDPMFKQAPDLEPIISARPKLTVNWAVGSLSGQPFKYRNPYSNRAHKEEEDKTSEVEYLAYGISHQVDALLRGRGIKESRQMRAAKQVVSGSVAWRPYIHPDGTFDIIFYDPATVFWLPGDFGLQKVVISVEMTLLDAANYVKSQGGAIVKAQGKETDKVKCAEYWVKDGDEVWRAYVVHPAVHTTLEARLDNADLALPFVKQPYDQIPLIAGCTNIPGDETSENQQRMDVYGLSILDPLMRSVQQANTWATIARIVAGQAVIPTEVSETHTGQGVNSDERLGQQRRVDLEIGEKWRYETRPPAALDVREQTQWFRQELDQSGVSPASLGDLTPMPPSAIMTETARFNSEVVKLQPFALGHKGLEQETMMWWLREFRGGGKPITLRGRHLQKNGADGFFEGEFKPAAVPQGYWEIVIEHEPARPLDKQAEFNLASAKYQVGAISKRRFMEETGVEDPAGEEMRQAEEQVNDSPEMVEARKVSAVEDMWIKAKNKLKEAAGNKASAGHLAKMRREVAALESMFLAMDRAHGMMMMGASVQAAQAQPGREAMQPNEPMMPPNPPSTVQPPEFRGEGREQQRLQQAAGASRNGGS